MLDGNVQILWDAYLKEERRYDRPAALVALDKFIRAIKKLPASEYESWALIVAEQIIDYGVKIPIRIPLFQQLVFPSLVAGYRAGSPGCARWLAGFNDLICSSEDCWKEPGIGLCSADALLKEAIKLDPDDHRAIRMLISNLTRYFDLTLHELPTGVLYGMDGASIEECGLLNQELDFFCELVEKENCFDQYSELIDKCRLHFSAYAEYLQCRKQYTNYSSYLAEKGRISS